MAAIVGVLAARPADEADAARAKPLSWMFHRGPGVAAVAADPAASHLLDGTQPIILRKPGNRLMIPTG